VSEAVVPVEQKGVDFYGTELVALRDQEGNIYVPLRRLCEAIGVDFRGQLTKVSNDPVMREQLQSAPVTLTDGRTYEMECLSLKYVRAWLFSINANRVKEEVRERLMQYQREVIEIIDRAFSRARPPAEVDLAVMEAMRENALQQARLWETIIEEKKRLRATEALLQEHDERLLDHDRHLWQHDEALHQTFSDLAALRQRQSEILTRVSDVLRLLPTPSERIGPAQKAAIKELVDDVVAAAQERGVRLGQGRNDYPAVWGALKQRFDVAKYDELSVAQYEDAVRWLKDWQDRIWRVD
jgi:hypothetical protein